MASRKKGYSVPQVQVEPETNIASEPAPTVNQVVAEALATGGSALGPLLPGELQFATKDCIDNGLPIPENVQRTLDQATEAKTQSERDALIERARQKCEIWVLAERARGHVETAEDKAAKPKMSEEAKAKLGIKKSILQDEERLKATYAKYPHVVPGSAKPDDHGGHTAVFTIKCIECGALRENVHAGDLFQVKMCKPCKEKSKKKPSVTDQAAKKLAKAQAKVEAMLPMPEAVKTGKQKRKEKLAKKREAKK